MDKEKFKRFIKSKVGIGVICFFVGGAMTSDASKVKELSAELEKSEQSIETLSKESETQLSTMESKDSEIKELQDKIDDASPWFDMTEEEREVEKERITQAKIQKEENERVANEEQAKKEEEERVAKEQVASSQNQISSSNSESQENVDSGLVISATGKKYHRPSCRTVKQVKQNVSAQQAQGMGYTACKICNP